MEQRHVLLGWRRYQTTLCVCHRLTGAVRALIAPELEGCRQSAWEKPSEFIRQELLNIGNNNTVVHLEDVLQFDRQESGRVKKRVLVLLMNVSGLSGPREELGTSSYSSK